MSQLVTDEVAPLPEPLGFTTSDGYEHAWRLWRPSGEAKGVIVALHGIQSHSGWYGESSAALAAAGYAVAFLDRRGSGVNGMHRGDAPHFERLINDVVQFVTHLSRTGLGDRPRILSAVSWGGKLASAVVAERPELFDGLALVAPGLCPKVGANVVQQAALNSAAATGAETRFVTIPLNDAALFTDIPAYRSFISGDPLALRQVTVRFLRASRALDKRVKTSLDSIRCPVLLMLAGRDRIIDNGKTRRLVASFGSPSITIRSYDDACHTLEFDSVRDRYVRELVEWLERL